jgi:hypothetical protein
MSDVCINCDISGRIFANDSLLFWFWNSVLVHPISSYAFMGVLYVIVWYLNTKFLVEFVRKPFCIELRLECTGVPVDE